MVSLNDMCDRPPRPLTDGEVIDLGGKRVRQLAHPARAPRLGGPGAVRGDHRHAPVRRPLLPRSGRDAALTTDDVVEPALAAEAMFHSSSLAPLDRRRPSAASATWPRRPWPSCTARSFQGDGGKALYDLADGYERQFLNAVA